jgi:chemotaxis-related protein WspB
MMYLVFHLGAERYALSTKHVVEILPRVEVRRIPQTAPGIGGVFNYRGTLVPLIDLNELVLGQPARPWLSSRIILVRDTKEGHLLGILVERATDTVRRDPSSFVDSGVESSSAPYLGAVATDEKGVLQLIDLDRLLHGPLRELVFGQLKEAA